MRIRGMLAGVFPALLTYAICRIPSFFEPRWYTDEAGYATTARAVLRGTPLYAATWTNKPPLHIWAIALPLRLFGPSEAGLHALTFISGLLTLLAVAVLATHLLSRTAATVATVIFAAAIGLPLFQAQLAVPESLLIAPTTWAAVLVFTRILPSHGEPGRFPHWRWAVAAGILMGISLGFKQTALADATVFAAVIGLGAPANRRALLGYVVALLAAVATWLVPSVVVGGAHAVGFALVGFYSSYIAFSLPNSSGGLALRALVPALALIAALTLRRDGQRIWALGLWACAELAVSAIANRPYPHFLVPALAPTILLLAAIQESWVRVRWRVAPLIVGLILMVPLAVLGRFDLNAVQAYVSWPQAQLRSQHAEWAAELDIRSPADEDAAQWIRENGFSGATAVVWSSDAWPYLLADLPLALPTAPIYNNVVLLGSGQAVATAVEGMQPQLIITSEEAIEQWPEIGPLLEASYHLAHESYPIRVYVRHDQPG